MYILQMECLNGHDYNSKLWDNKGVKKAVNELIEKFEVRDNIWITKIL